jgi:hypothetical protein
MILTMGRGSGWSLKTGTQRQAIVPPRIDLLSLGIQVRRSAQQIDELLDPGFARSEPRDSYGLARREFLPTPRRSAG